MNVNSTVGYSCNQKLLVTAKVVTSSVLNVSVQGNGTLTSSSNIIYKIVSIKWEFPQKKVFSK